MKTSPYFAATFAAALLAEPLVALAVDASIGVSQSVSQALGDLSTTNYWSEAIDHARETVASNSELLSESDKLKWESFLKTLEDAGPTSLANNAPEHLKVMHEAFQVFAWLLKAHTLPSVPLHAHGDCTITPVVRKGEALKIHYPMKVLASLVITNMPTFLMSHQVYNLQKDSTTSDWRFTGGALCTSNHSPVGTALLPSQENVEAANRAITHISIP